MKMKLPRSTPVVALVAAGCLLLGSTGGAVAGALITGKQIKDNTVTTKDIKNGSLAVKDLSKKTRSALAGTAGPTGATGATGPAGAAGPRGFSAWDTIPQGVTVTGRFFDAGRTAGTTGIREENINFPARLPAPPTNWGFGADTFPFTPNDAACTGTFLNPTAPAGRVCVYVEHLSNFSDIEVFGWDAVEHQTHAFYLELTESAPDDSFNYYGSWAYTAP